MDPKTKPSYSSRATLELNVRHVSDERQTLQEEISRRTREKDRELRALKKADLQLRVAQDGLEHTSGVHNKMQSMVKTVTSRHKSAQVKRRRTAGKAKLIAHS